MTQKAINKMDKIKGDTFADVYLIGSIKSFNIRVDHRDKKSLNVIKKNIEVKLPSIQNAIERNGLTLCWVSNDEYLLLNQKKENDTLLKEFQKQMNLTTGVAENTTDLRVWFLIKGNRACLLYTSPSPRD